MPWLSPSFSHLLPIFTYILASSHVAPRRASIQGDPICPRSLFLPPWPAVRGILRILPRPVGKISFFFFSLSSLLHLSIASRDFPNGFPFHWSATTRSERSGASSGADGGKGTMGFTTHRRRQLPASLNYFTRIPARRCGAKKKQQYFVRGTAKIR